VSGVVTFVKKDGFYMQDPEPDENNATSEGIFVYTMKAPQISKENYIIVNGIVKEYRWGKKNNNLTVTEIIPYDYIIVNSTSNLGIAPTIIGVGGRIPPDRIIEDDAKGDINFNNNNTFDPDSDGLDFYESLEGMLVQINDAVIVKPSNSTSVPVVGDNGIKATIISQHGGIVVSNNDFNPERVFIGFTQKNLTFNVGNRFDGPIIGVMGYANYNYIVETKALPKILTQDKKLELTIATFNVENLAPTSNKFDRLADQIVIDLKSPDIIAIQEIQDNDGNKKGNVVDANVTFNKLITAIKDANGPDYKFFDIDPQYNQDGGEGNANIRIGFLYKVEPELSFQAIAGGNATNPVKLVSGSDGAHLSFNPGRIEPLNKSFKSSRKPLAAEFLFRGHKLFVIANHFNSKGGDQPLYGYNQPPSRTSEETRHLQAQIVHDFVSSILKIEPDADVVVLGDLNDFQFSKTVEILKGDLLTNVIDSLPANDQYTINYEGNSEVLDQILVSKNLSNMSIEADIVHINSDFMNNTSDHDPVLVHISFSP
jgi:hypothetical protein